MHEISLMRDLMRKVIEVSTAEKAKRVVTVNVWLGALSHMSPEHFQEHFEEAACGTLAEGANLIVEVSDDVNDANAQSILFRGLEIEGTDLDD